MVVAHDQFQQQFQQGDHSAVKAIDSAVASMGLRERFDAMCDNFVEHVGNLIDNAIGKVAGAVNKGIDHGRNAMQGVSDRVSAATTPSMSQTKADATPQIERSPSIEVVKQAQMAVSAPTFATHDVSAGDHNFVASPTPAVGMGVGRGQALGI